MMEGEVTIKDGDKEYSASYIVIDDNLTVYLPDGSSRETWLRGLSP